MTRTLTTTQPPRVTALTGIDALAHAIETYVTKRRNSLSLAFSREAWRHLAPNLSRVISEPADLPTRGEMQLGACLAGLAIENSMLGAVHALANPLTAAYGVAHGEAIALMLPHVIRRNGQLVEAWYQELAECCRGNGFAVKSGSASGAIADYVTEISRKAGLAGKLSECDVPRVDLPKLAAAATQQWTGKFNPVELMGDDYLKLYETAY